jgi:hypothetical protein
MILPQFRVSGGVQFPEHLVPGHLGQKKQVTRRTRLPYSEHEAGTHIAVEQGVAGNFIPRQRTRQPLEGEDDSEETPALLA